jgi:nucleoside-diphosphate-sugar epimerase
MKYTVKELAELIVELVGEFEGYEDIARNTLIEEVSADEYYGASYEDVVHRVPKVEEAKRHLGWEPTTDLRTALRLTLDYHLKNQDYELNQCLVR